VRRKQSRPPVCRSSGKQTIEFWNQVLVRESVAVFFMRAGALSVFTVFFISAKQSIENSNLTNISRQPVTVLALPWREISNRHVLNKSA
jgi:hypothetical protein